MLQKLLNNIPNIENKKEDTMRNLHQSNFYNLEAMQCKNRKENFDNNIASLYKTSLHSSHVVMQKNKKTDVEISVQDDDAEKGSLSVLSAITSDEKPIPKKIPSVKGIDNGDVDIDRIDTKKYKLDWISTVYVGSISVIGLFIAYKAIKRTM
jgi:hypothetical protein